MEKAVPRKKVKPNNTKEANLVESNIEKRVKLSDIFILKGVFRSG